MSAQAVAVRGLEALRSAHQREFETYRSLTGTIYPSIQYLALCHLREDYVAAGGDLLDLPLVPPPGPDGRVPQTL
mgnify:CR=1 FL=1